MIGTGHISIINIADGQCSISLSPSGRFADLPGEGVRAPCVNGECGQINVRDKSAEPFALLGLWAPLWPAARAADSRDFGACLWETMVKLLRWHFALANLFVSSFGSKDAHFCLHFASTEG